MTESAEESIASADLNHVKGLVTVACRKEEWEPNLEVAQSSDNIWLAAGVHPHEAKDSIAGLETFVESQSGPNSKLVALGECGLDYYYEHSPRDIQLEVFSQQIHLAKKHDLTLVVHTRDAWEDTFSIFKSVGVPDKTVIHCFTGGVDEAKKCLDLGAYISFSGIATFNKADDVRQAALAVPEDRIVIETDSPFLAPVPYRGKKNHPGHVAVVGEFLAELRSSNVQQFAHVTTANAKNLFGIK